MTKLSEKIMKISFAKKLKHLIIVALCVGLVGGGLSAFLLRTQIGEMIAYRQEWKQNGENRYYEGEPDNTADYGGQIGRWNGKIGRGSQMEGWGGKSGWGVWTGKWYGKPGVSEKAQITEPTTAAKVTVAIVGLLGGLLAFAFWLLFVTWLYQAAVRSGMNGLLWMAAGIFFHMFAAVAFLLVRSFIRAKCPSCGSFQSGKAQHCSKCGAAMNEKCAGCGETCAAGDKFCRACGKPLHEKEG